MKGFDPGVIEELMKAINVRALGWGELSVTDTFWNFNPDLKKSLFKVFHHCKRMFPRSQCHVHNKFTLHKISLLNGIKNPETHSENVCDSLLR